MTYSIDRLLDLPLPEAKGNPHEVMRRRVLIGAALLGLGVALLSFVNQGMVEGWASTWPIAAFAVGCVLLLVLTRVGVSTAVVRVIALALVGTFLVVISLETVHTDWGQLKWLGLIPFITHYLWDPDPTSENRRPRSGPLLAGGVLAIALTGLIILLRLAGLTAGLPLPTSGTFDETVGGFIDVALFVLSIVALMALYDRSRRKADDEIRMLRSLLSMCAWCRRIRDEDDGWLTVERYMAKHSSTPLSHGMCPECEAKMVATLG